MSKKPLQLEVGQKYRGYGLLNEFGEFEFIPEETGSRLGTVKLVKQTDTLTVSTTKKYVIVHFKVKRDEDKTTKLRNVFKAMNELITIFREYDI